MTTKAKLWLARWRALRPRLAVAAQRLACRRGVATVLLLAAWLLPFFVPPVSATASLPDCCMWDGAHKCSLRQAVNAGVPVMTVPCTAPAAKIISSADRPALHSANVPARTLWSAPREALADRVDQVPAAVFGVRSSRAPPRCV